jgi:hypothetical protein
VAEVSSVKTALVLAFVLLQPVFARAQASRYTDWSSLHFVSLTTRADGVKPLSGGGVSMAVQILADSAGSHYVETFEQGRTWDCIRMILDAMLDKEMFAPESLLGWHSGRSWFFWWDVAELERLATKTNAPLDPDTYRVLHEMEEAFSELLPPDKATEFFFGRKLEE